MYWPSPPRTAVSFPRSPMKQEATRRGRAAPTDLCTPSGGSRPPAALRRRGRRRRSAGRPRVRVHLLAEVGSEGDPLDADGADRREHLGRRAGREGADARHRAQLDPRAEVGELRALRRAEVRAREVFGRVREQHPAPAREVAHDGVVLGGAHVAGREDGVVIVRRARAPRRSRGAARRRRRSPRCPGPGSPSCGPIPLS